VPLFVSFPDRLVSNASWRAIPFAALGLSHEAAA
jgi:hypothetical protein